LQLLRLLEDRHLIQVVLRVALKALYKPVKDLVVGLL
jgi:hypothetical protein